MLSTGAAGLGLLAGCGRLPWQAEQPRVARIGFLAPPGTLPVFIEGFREGLRQHNYVEGQNIVVEWRVVGGAGETRGLAAAPGGLHRGIILCLVPAFPPALEARK